MKPCGEALDFMFSHPAYEVQLAFEKLYHLYEDDSGALQWIRAPRGAAGRGVADRPQHYPAVSPSGRAARLHTARG